MTTEIETLLVELRAPAWDRKAEALRQVTAKAAAGNLSKDDEGALAPVVISLANDPKWEVQKAAAVALSELRHTDAAVIQATLEALARTQQTHFVKKAAEQALKRVRSRAQRQQEWKLTDPTRDPTLQHIMKTIREIGLRSMTPAHIYDLAMEISEQAYRELAADTAHEVRNIIAPFEGYLAELRERLVDDRKASSMDTLELLDLALDRFEHITRFVDDIGVYSAPVAADFSAVDLAELVKEAVAIGADRGDETASAAGNVVQNIQLETIVIDALPSRLTRAITNLVANAYQAMDKGGVLTVRSSVADGERVKLTIEDTGVGMTPEAVEQARVRFRSTKRGSGGTGLGLPIAERIIVEDHRGALDIDSTKGKGTMITILLPVRQAADASEEMA